MSANGECITSFAGYCGPALYEWLWLEPAMHPPGWDGESGWIPLCEECCTYWRTKENERGNSKPFRVRSISRAA